MKLSKEVKVGLFMISAIVLLYFGFNFLKGIDFFSSDEKYYAIYHNVNGLTESNQVFLNGYAVGRVSDMIIEQRKNRVVVELSINSDILVTTSTTAILNGDLLGDRYIQLSGGADGPRLEPGDTLRADIAKGIADLIAENAEPIAATLKNSLQKLNALVDSLRITSSLANRALETTPRQLNYTLYNLNNKMGKVAGTFDEVGANLNTTLTELQPTLKNFKTLSDSLKLLELNNTLNKAQHSLTKLNETLSALNSGDNTASKLLTEDSLYVNLNNLLMNLDSLATHFSRNPRHFLAPLGKSRRKIERDLERQRAAGEKN